LPILLAEASFFPLRSLEDSQLFTSICCIYFQIRLQDNFSVYYAVECDTYVVYIIILYFRKAPGGMR
jgi:hypothetical protein